MKNVKEIRTLFEMWWDSCSFDSLDSPSGKLLLRSLNPAIQELKHSLKPLAELRSALATDRIAVKLGPTDEKHLRGLKVYAISMGKLLGCYALQDDLVIRCLKYHHNVACRKSHSKSERLKAKENMEAIFNSMLPNLNESKTQAVSVESLEKDLKILEAVYEKNKSKLRTGFNSDAQRKICIQETLRQIGVKGIGRESSDNLFKGRTKIGFIESFIQLKYKKPLKDGYTQYSSDAIRKKIKVARRHRKDRQEFSKQVALLNLTIK